MNSLLLLDNVRIVLSHTSHPGNIGAAARAMKTMGINSLYLVNPKIFPDKEAEARSAGAWDVLNNAKICTNLDEALDKTLLVAAITARRRNLSHDTFDSRQGAKKLLDQAKKGPVALIFGAETSGLTTEEVNKCQIFVHIPTDPNYLSLNLASAVQVMTYELQMALPKINCLPHRSSTLASFNDVELFYCHLERIMIDTSFLNPREPKRLMQRMRRLFSRARLEKEEVNILRGILNSVEKNITEKNPTKIL